MYRIGVISDTHGLLRPEVLKEFRGVDYILHAGDVGSPLVLDSLRNIAPVTAVRGNVDDEEWARALPVGAVVELHGVYFYVIHNRHDLDLDPGKAGFAAVICGHSHRPRQDWVNGVLFFNPGGAGPRRFRLPVSLGMLTIRGKEISSKLIMIAV
jgi:putative phosphoesterase